MVLPAWTRPRVLAERSLRTTLSLARKVLVSHPMLRNALMDVTSTSEFTSLYEHEKMLADQTRMEAYARGIARDIKAGESVIDLGTGSGILALLAARNNPARIYAIDHSSFIDVARELAAHHTDVPIEFIQTNSRHFQPAEKVDVILHEQIGDELFEENMIENLLDLKQRALKPGGRILPGRFELYIEPFTCKPAFRVPYLWEQERAGIDFRPLRGSEVIDRFQTDGHHLRYVEAASVQQLLCTPEPVLRFDLNDPDFEPRFTIPRQQRTVEHAGQLDGLCIYFKVIFDEQTSFDTSPLNGRGSNWGNRCFRTEARHCQAGDRLVYDVDMPEHVLPETWRLSLIEAPPAAPAAHAEAAASP